MQHTPQVTREIRALASFYGIRLMPRFLTRLAPHLREYAELVIGERGFEVVTGGRGATARKALADLADRYGACDAAIAAFQTCCAAFPDRMMGAKLPVAPSDSPPTLYVRVMAPVDEGIMFLRRLPRTATIIRSLTRSRILYGLGFTTLRTRLHVKTYVIGDVASRKTGFISERTDGSRKRYWPDIPLDVLKLPGRRWQRLCRFVVHELKLDRAGHVGVSGRNAKIYIERVGAIPTDSSAR